MFRTYYFCEMPYAYTPRTEFADVTRTVMPNRWVDPGATYELYHKYFDLVKVADECGLDVMFNEHHETMSNLNAAMPLTVAIAARETRDCRLLVLGNPACNRPDPVRVATEMAMIDVVSHGRLDCGFVKGSPYELSATNARPTDMTARVYEAIDLTVKAWTSHDGPFNFEGDFFHHREVNIVPRPYQQPHPPVWITSTTLQSAPEIARRDYTLATMMIGTQPSAELFKCYRDVYAKAHGAQPHPEKLAYCGLVYVGDSDERALSEAGKIQDFFIQSFRAPPGSLDLPGYLPPSARAAMYKAAAEEGGSTDIHVDKTGHADPLDLVNQGVGFFGTPDSVFEQLKAFFHGVGGFGNFMGLFHGSTMTYDDTSRSMRLFATEVLPRFREEVYEPWLKERGLKRVLVPEGVEVEPLAVPQAEAGGSTFRR